MKERAHSLTLQETAEFAVPTSALIKAYNRVGKPSFKGKHGMDEYPNWPLSLRRSHPVIAGVGLGNAMADHVSMLLVDRVFLDETDANPRFLRSVFKSWYKRIFPVVV